MFRVLVALFCLSEFALGCSDFYMRFESEDIKLSARTNDLGNMCNWTVTTWPAKSEIKSAVEDVSFRWTSKYNTVGISGNWLGDDRQLFPSFFADSLNEKGLSCSMLALLGTEYEQHEEDKINVFYGTFCQYVTQMYSTTFELMNAIDDIRIYGPPVLTEHFVVRDAEGKSLVIELINGKKQLYLDLNDGGETGYGIMTNEPTFDYHLKNIAHYEWKRTLARQAVAIVGGYYPEERYLRIHMMKSGMESADDWKTTDYQQAFSLTTQVLNTITVPMGAQYGTDTGENSGEGTDNDHTIFGMVRDHKNPTFYWRDSINPTFRRLRLEDVDFSTQTVSMLTLETGPYFVDMADKLSPM